MERLQETGNLNADFPGRFFSTRTAPAGELLLLV